MDLYLLKSYIGIYINIYSNTYVYVYIVIYNTSVDQTLVYGQAVTNRTTYDIIYSITHGTGVITKGIHTYA